MHCMIYKSCPHNIHRLGMESQCISSGVQVCKKHSFLYSSLPELNSYSGSQFCQVAEIQSQSTLVTVLQNCVYKIPSGGHLALSVISYPCWHPLSLLSSSLVCGHWSLQVVTAEPLCPHSKDTLGLLALCVFHRRNFTSVYCSRLRKTVSFSQPTCPVKLFFSRAPVHLRFLSFSSNKQACSMGISKVNTFILSDVI
jgi:hypothetical protein